MKGLIIAIILAAGIITWVGCVVAITQTSALVGYECMEVCGSTTDGER